MLMVCCIIDNRDLWLYGHMVTLDFDSSWIISVGSVPQSMQFTMEKEGHIPKDDSSVQENTHTQIHTPDPTTMHPRTIAGVVKCLKSRANRVCDERSKAYGDGTSEINLHGYPEQLTTRMILMNKPLSRTETEPEPRKTLYIPYIRGLSKKIENVCNPLIIRLKFSKQLQPQASCMSRQQPPLM